MKALSEQLEGAEKVRIEMQKKIELESTMRENKHKQLLESINLSQRSEVSNRIPLHFDFSPSNINSPLNFEFLFPSYSLSLPF